MAGMDKPAELQRNGNWRMAVWALRVGGLGLAVALVGVIVMSAGGTPWILAAGVFIWLAAAAVTLTGFFRARHDLPEPRPGFWSTRFMLIHDTVHARPSDAPR
jgi:O-antigen/teichoic acid export membrane protein